MPSWEIFVSLCHGEKCLSTNPMLGDASVGDILQGHTFAVQVVSKHNKRRMKEAARALLSTNVDPA